MQLWPRIRNLYQSKTKLNQIQNNAVTKVFANFWPSDILVIKHVLKVGNSVAASDISIEPIQNQTKPTPNYSQHYDFWQLLAYSDVLVFKNNVHKLAN